jgi:nitrogen fixation protein
MSVVIDSDNNNVTIVEEAINVTISTGGSDVSAVWGNITGDIEEQTDLIELLDDKVPYTGATTNVDLGEFELKAGQVTLDTSPTGTAAVGTIRWNDTTGTSETTLKGGSVIIKNGVDLVIRVVNKVTPNTTLTKAAYQVVKIGGAQGQRLAVGLAQANNDNNSADTIGIVIESIATNQQGFIMTVGSLESINTTGSLQGETWSDGDVLYLSPTIAGRITNVKPVAPQHLVVVGYVEYAHANNGKIYVKIMNGWELGELHDVNTAGATNGQVLKYNGSIWVPGSDTAGISSIATSAPITGGTITTSGTIGITQATGSTDGYLSATDWTTFNSKQATLTLTTSGTSGAATLVGATLNIPQYQEVLTNPVTGTGASGQVAYWSGTGTQTGSNNLFWDNANRRLGIGTNAPTINLQVETSLNSSAGIYTRNNNSGNLAYGYVNANNNLSASIDIRSHSSGHGVWANTGMLITTSGLTGGMVLFVNGNAPMAFWTNTVERMRIFGGGNISIGTSSDLSARLAVRGSGTTSATTALLVQNSTPSELFKVLDNGRISQTLVSSSNSTAFGEGALRLATGGLNSAFGYLAAFNNTTGAQNVFFGRSAGQNNTTGGNNLFLGAYAGLNNTTGVNNLFLGLEAGAYITGGSTANTIANNSIFIGRDTRAAADNETNQIVIGYLTTGLGSNTTTIGNTSTTQTHLYGNLTLGLTTSGSQKLRVIDTANAIVAAIGGGAASPSVVGIGTVNSGALPFIQGYNNTLTGTAELSLNPSGANVIIGTTTSGGRLTVRGSGTTSATTALLVQNNTPTELFKVRDDGHVTFGSSSLTGFRIVRINYSNSDYYIGQGGGTVMGFSAGNYSYILSDANVAAIYGTLKSQPLIFGTNNTENMRIESGGDTAIGTTTTSGGRLTVRGSGTTSAANSLLVEDSAGTDTFVVRNDGGYAFKGGTVGLAQTGYTTFTNLTTDRTCDANSTSVEELADILGTLIEDLKTKGIISA